MPDWKGTRVLIIGAARQGLALARFLAGKGADVILNDQRQDDEIQAAMQSLTNTPVKWSLGGHPLHLLEGVDLLCPSGGVPLTIPLVQEALRRGIPLSNDSQIFLEEVPCRVIGITGSAGKTTTTTLVGRMAQAAVNRSPFTRPYSGVWVGGNIGTPLITDLDRMQKEDLAVMELSSFQLEIMTKAPSIAAVLNVTPNHLDRHGDMDNYVATKARIIQFQSADQPERTQPEAVLNHDDAISWSLRQIAKGRVTSFGMKELPSDQCGVFVQDDNLVLRTEGGESILMPREEIQMRGEHNLQNVLAACAIAYAAGLLPQAMVAGVAGFLGVPHRLEFVRSWRGVDWYNDSIATAPERTIAAIKSFEEPLVLLLGGRDKNLHWEDLMKLVRERVDHLILFGEAADKIARELGRSNMRPNKLSPRPFSVDQSVGLADAVIRASTVASAGDVVLLAPGGTSFDEFRDFEHRGEAFKKWVQELP